jgi:RHS repeat-associated protein
MLYGTNGTNSRRYMGPLPAAGGWVRLEVPAFLVGVHDTTLSGMSMSWHTGRAWFDRAGKLSTAGAETVWFDDALPTGATLISPSASSATWTDGGIGCDFAFTGHYRHAKSGLQLAKWRAYDAEIGRWLSRDPIAEYGGINLYEYAESNPVNLADPLGLRPALEPIRYIAPPAPIPRKPLFSPAGGSALGGLVMMGWLYIETLTDFAVCTINFAFDALDNNLNRLQNGGGAAPESSPPSSPAPLPPPPPAPDDGGEKPPPPPPPAPPTTPPDPDDNKPKWPRTPEEMDEFLKIRGARIPDGPRTPGRGKVVWRPNQNTKITYERHPYHPNAPEWHRGPHWHLDTPAGTHLRFVPGDPIPGY